MTLLPDFNQAEFEMNAPINNIYFPLTPGTILAYGAINEENEDSFVENNQVYVTFDTQNVLGVETIVVRDVEWEEGILVEDTFDWYAQDIAGNIWYFGEDSTSYEYDQEGNFLGTNKNGSWEAGVEDALPGYLIPANPQIGDSYFQEFAPGIAEDEAEVVSLNESVEIDLDVFDNVLKTREFSQLDPGVFEFKYFAPGVGQILADEGLTEVGGEPELSPELVGISTFSDATLPTLFTANFESSTEIDNPYFPLTPGSFYIYQGEEVDEDTGEIEVEQETVFMTSETKEILGITSRVVQENSFDNGVLTEEEFAYYAQDDDGNVWLLGESSTEYEYDDAGNLIEVEGESWQAGQDQNLPGYVMVANPEVGDSYYEQFQIGEEEEQAEVISSDASISTNFGDFENVIQIREFSDLEPDEFEFSYYAPGLGQVFEEEFEDGELDFSSALVNTGNITNSLNGSFGDDILVGDDSNNLILALAGDDIVAGGLGDDIIFGNEGADILRGDNNSRSSGTAGGGNDIIFGGAGDDRIGGKAGNDELLGEQGNDQIWGDDGDDILKGGLGNDTLTGDDFSGGSGSDTFILAVGAGTDTITDFEVGIDVIGLENDLMSNELSIVQVGNNTEMSLGDETLAVLNGVNANSFLESNPFILV
ncbi:MAG: calcium-binding protein [Cyanobacteria bacterium J06592_8]